MDFGSIGLAALIGAIGGGGGALLGQFIAHKFKLNSPILIGLTASVGFALSQLIDVSSDRSEDVRRELEAGFAKQPLLEKIYTGFPTEYEEFIDGFVRDANSITAEEAKKRGYEFTSGIRIKHATNVRSAEDDNLKSALIAQKNTIIFVRDNFEPSECSSYIIEGPIKFANQSEALNEQLAIEGSKLFDAILDGRTKKNPAAEPSQADWNAFLEYWYERDGTPDYLASINALEPSDLELCDSFISLLSSIAKFEGDAGRRIRAETIYQSASTK